MIIKGARGDLTVFEGDLLLGVDGHYGVMRQGGRVMACDQITGKVWPIVDISHKMLCHIEADVPNEGGHAVIRKVEDIELDALQKRIQYIIKHTIGVERANYEYIERRLGKTGRITIKQKRAIEDRSRGLGFPGGPGQTENERKEKGS
jgi:hypothetical protein